MNDHFINVKVDREERPDVDKVYMSFVQASTGGGGWPMSVFLTPQLKPVFGGTYFPPGTMISGVRRGAEVVPPIFRSREKCIFGNNTIKVCLKLFFSYIVVS